MTNDAAPIIPALQAAGFQPQGRSADPMMIMAHVLEPETLAAAVWRADAATADLEVIAWTPEREVVLHRAASPQTRRVRLEMKEDALTRLLFCRLDLRAAVAQEIVDRAGRDRRRSAGHRGGAAVYAVGLSLSGSNLRISLEGMLHECLSDRRSRSSADCDANLAACRAARGLEGRIAPYGPIAGRALSQLCAQGGVGDVCGRRGS